MISKYVDMFLVVFISLCLSQGRFSRELFVSQTNASKDIMACGNSTTPCRTIAYTLSKIKEHGYIVNIDGGHNLTSPYVYNIKKELYINYSMKLRNWVNDLEINSSKPIILLRKTLTISSKVTFTAINCLPAFGYGRIQIRFTCNKINITDCSFQLSFLIYSYNKNMSIDFDITNSKFSMTLPQAKIDLKQERSNSTRLNMKIYGDHIVIQDSHIVQGYISTCPLSNVEIKNCTFEETILYFEQMKFTLYSCKFNNGSKLLVSTRLESNIKSCMFNNTIFKVKITHRNSKLHILDTAFQNSKSYTARTALEIYDPRFVNNDETKAVSGTKVELIRCSFRNILHQNIGYRRENPSSLKIELSLSNIILNHCEFQSTSDDDIVFSISRWGTSMRNTSVICKAGTVLRDRLSKKTLWLGPVQSKFIDLMFELMCKTCEKSTYILERKYFVTSPRYQIEYNMHKNNTCIPCPYNGICENGKIALKGGYWGYRNTRNIYNMGNISMISCPVYYCCSTRQQCISYNTCAEHRTGRLCSECQKGFSSDISSKYKCTKNSDCNNGIITFALYTILAVIFVVIFLYLKEIILFLKNFKKSQEGEERVTKNNEDEFEATQLRERFLHEGVVRGDLRPQIPYQILDTSDGTNSENYRNSSYIITGSVKIIFFFYQAATLIRIQSVNKSELMFPKFFDFLSTVFNIKLDISHSKLVACVLPNINVIQAKMIKLGFIFMVFWVITLIWIARFTYKTIRNKILNPIQETHETTYIRIDDAVPSYSKFPFIVRVKCVYVQFLLIAYASIATFAFDAVYCVDINGESYLYTQASIKCYQPWQYGVIALIVLWIVPFALSLYLGTKLLYQCSINPTQFLVMITFPPAALGILLMQKFQLNKQQLSTEEAMLAKHLLVVNEPFRLSTTCDGSKLCWETMLIIRRMLMVIAKTFIMPAMLKLYPMALLLLLYVFQHIMMKPFSDAMLNKFELGSLLALLSLVFVNMFWAVTTEYGIMNNPTYSVFGGIAMYYEMAILSLLFILLACYMVYSISRLFYRLCKRVYHSVLYKQG